MKDIAAIQFKILSTVFYLFVCFNTYFGRLVLGSLLSTLFLSCPGLYYKFYFQDFQTCPKLVSIYLIMAHLLCLSKIINIDVFYKLAAISCAM